MMSECIIEAFVFEVLITYFLMTNGIASVGSLLSFYIYRNNTFVYQLKVASDLGKHHAIYLYELLYC